MADQDDIFDLEDFVRKHGDTHIKKAWRDHMSLFHELDISHARYERLMRSIRTMKDVVEEEDRL